MQLGRGRRQQHASVGKRTHREVLVAAVGIGRNQLRLAPGLPLIGRATREQTKQRVLVMRVAVVRSPQEEEQDIARGGPGQVRADGVDPGLVVQGHAVDHLPAHDEGGANRFNGTDPWGYE